PIFRDRISVCSPTLIYSRSRFISSLRLFFFNATATTEIYTLSLHDALPILRGRHYAVGRPGINQQGIECLQRRLDRFAGLRGQADRKSTRLNSSHVAISYAVFCLKKKKTNDRRLSAHLGNIAQEHEITVRRV